MDENSIRDACENLSLAINSFEETVAIAWAEYLINNNVQITVNLKDMQPTTRVVEAQDIFANRERRPMNDPLVIELLTQLNPYGLPPVVSYEAASICRNLEECKKYLREKKRININ